MLKLERLLFAFVGTGLLVAACAAPTDPAPAEPAEEATTPPATEEDVASTQADLDQDEAQASTDYEHGHWRDRDRFGGVHRPLMCNDGDAYHCRRHHRGWRWSGAPFGDGWQQGRRCCVHVAHPPHW